MRLIDADRLSKKCVKLKWLFHNNDKKLENTVRTICKLIPTILADEPTVEAKPVIHAHWEWREMPFAKDAPFCTNCNKTGFYATEYCSHCGAIIDEEKSE